MESTWSKNFLYCSTILSAIVTSSESSGHVPYVARDRMRSNRSSAANLGSMPLRKTPSYCPLSMIRSVTGTKEYSNSESTPVLVYRSYAASAASCAPTRQRRAAVPAILHAVFDERDPALVRELYHLACERIAGICPRSAELLEDAEADALGAVAALGAG